MTPAQPDHDSRILLEKIITTEVLNTRPRRSPDHEALNRALMALARELAASPQSVLQKLVDTTLTLCRAHSSGISLLEEENGCKIFRWHALAGSYAPHVMGTTPREFSPCGTVLDTDAVQLMTYLDRHYEYFRPIEPRVVEALLVPFHVGGVAVGTIWVVAHDEERQFDGEDARVMKRLAEFAATAYQVVSSVKALNEAHASLEKKVQEAKVTELELRRLNEDLNHFAGAASHDLQEPLRMITSYSQLLVKNVPGQIDKETLVCVGFITQGAKRMQDLLADLLSYTQTGTDSHEPAKAIDLNPVFAEAVHNLQMAIAESGAVVTTGPLPVALGESAHFLQLFQNLIGNAIKYHGGVSPRVHLSAEKQQGEWVFALADNGIGIAPEYHKTIFGVLKRLHGREIPGTGIGLAICQRVVERCGGRIWVQSQLGEGATFYFTLPAVERDVLQMARGHLVG